MQGTNHTESDTRAGLAPGTYFVDDVLYAEYGEPYLWIATTDGPVGVVSKAELDDRDETLWPVLTGVLTQDDETVDRIARAISAAFCVTPWDESGEESQRFLLSLARAALVGVLPTTGAEVTS